VPDDDGRAWTADDLAEARRSLRGVARHPAAIGFDGIDDLLSKIRGRALEGTEIGGLIGDGWFTMSAGEAHGVPATRGVFTWHRHTSGPALFSIEDFATFRAIGGRWHLLTTPEGWCVYAVTGPARVSPPAVGGTCPPTLRMRRWHRWAEDAFGRSIEEIDDAALCRAFGVRRRSGGPASCR
jgi:hypothetical protein